MKYRLPELDIPSDNPFLNDALDRKPLVEFLAGLIARLEGPFVLALDSPWGTGKTTIVKMLQAKLMADQFQCVYFNAWKVDYVTDPLVALVSGLDDIHLNDDGAESEFRCHLNTVKKIASAVAKRAVVAGVKVATLGVLDIEEDFEKVVADATSEVAGNLVDDFQKEKRALEKFREEVEKAVELLKAAGQKETLVFFIDELDRCRPTFAIEMLERIKHLFDAPHIVFVLSVDKSQLEASTAAVYGEKINAPEYLRRFIDLEYGIPMVETKRFTQTLLTRFELDSAFSKRNGEQTRYDKDNFVDTFTELSDVHNMSLRARERCIGRLCIVIEQTPPDHYLDPILLAFLMVLRLKNIDLFRRLCSGIDGPEEAMQYLSGLPGGVQFVANRSGLLIEAYLIAADPNKERSEARHLALKRQVDELDESDPPVVKFRARELAAIRRHIFSGFRTSVSLAGVAGKIDLTASVRD
ncbi:KAP family NTPase [Rhodoferax sp. U2-2l]|uniref:KAP family P-loop NTPase fold protein n=1 Tax=Rhodoferax sp. U2-2l TaxID=2884000 RepID=UPI001D0B3080|nr:P-loop NTPase fold protein [Rhodoferax sp. U2-2l]MCB8746417.1 KAP family NTPase [Rhodoferax sp. U2-2l]